MASRDLPEDVIPEILLRFPAKSLLRFRSVSKKWCAQIDSPFFRKKHFAYLLSRYDDELIVVNTEYFAKNVVTCYDDYQSLSCLNSSCKLDIDSVCYTSCCYHINGIVCVARFGGDGCGIFLCNPALREFRKLPKLGRSPPGFGITYPIQIRGVGIGFDDATDDYIVVKFLHHSGDTELISVSYHVKTQSWTMIEMPSYVSAYASKFRKFYSSFFFHGSIHWCVGWRHVILTFNTGSNVFQEIRFPDGWKDYGYNGDSHLFKVDSSCIALVGALDLDKLDVWVMKEYGVAESWTKLYSLLHLPPIQRPLSFWRKDKLFLRAASGEIICYDLLTGQLFEPRGQCDSVSLPLPNRSTLQVVTCVGSLVSINQS